MKKLLSLVVMVGFVAALNAQTITHKFTVTLNSPAASATIANGSTINQAFVISLTQGNIVPADTIAYRDPFVPSGQVWVRTGITKNQGDTIQINRTYSGISATPGVINYCVAAFKFNNGTFSVGFDSTGNSAGTGTFRDCNSVTITGFPAGVKNMFFDENTQSQKINVYPNPAVGNTINMDYVAQNASSVEVSVYDLTGRKVMSHSYGQSFKGQEGFNLDISSLNNGMYILEMRQEGIKATTQFVK